jgi:hypothetical protein
MPAITLKNIPADLYAEIKNNAKTNCRSLNQEILFRLRKSLSLQRTDPDQIIKKIEQLHKKCQIPELTEKILMRAKTEGRP